MITAEGVRLVSEYVRVTVTLPEDLYRKVRLATDNVSGFIAEALRDRFTADAFRQALQDSGGLWRERLGGAEDLDTLLAELHEDRSGWERADR